MNKTFLLIIITLLSVFIIGCKHELTPEMVKACTDSGGVIDNASCCGHDSIIPFTKQDSIPGDCPISPIRLCNCTKANSHIIKVCDCPAPKCWDGTHCTSE